MDDFELEIKKEFINEALINLEEVEGAFMELESSAETQPLLDKIFRMAHNLKGGSRAVGFGDVAEFTHNLENLVLKIQKKEVQLSSSVVTTLLRCNDRLVEMLNELKSDLNAKFNNEDLIADIKKWLEGKNEVAVVDTVAVEAPGQASAPTVMSPAVQAPVVEASDNAIDSIQVETSEPLPPSADAFFAPAATSSIEVSPSSVVVTERNELAPEATISQPAPAAPTKKVEKTEKDDEVIRVNLSRIDKLNDYVGELIVLQSVIQQQAQTTLSTQLSASVQQMVKLSKDIQGLSMSLRMLPVKPLVQKLQRVVRDTAKALNKDVQLEVIGEGMDIDKSVLDRLADPLIHILRNAVDHGLEVPEDRLKASKNQQGLVVLSFANEGNHLIVEIRDDGKGINTEILKSKAIEKGLISASQNYSEKQLIHLIFHPGFSTKAVTSEISGRGVGMDVVKTNIEKIGGHVDVTTKLGVGSVFKLQIPLSLAVIEGLIVTSEKNRYVIPLSQVQETINLKTQKVFEGRLGIGTCFELRGLVVPLFGLEETLQGKNSSQIENETCLVVQVNERLLGLVVKEIVRSQQVVIKPFSGGIKTQKGWIGSCVLGDGLPTLIISPVDLLEGKIVQVLSTNKNEKAA